MVAFGGGPAPGPAEAITVVRQCLVQVEARGGRAWPRFQPGERVRITGGALAGREAIIAGPVGPAERVRVRLHFLGEVNRAIVSLENLERCAGQSSSESGVGGDLGFLPRRLRRTRGHGRPICRYAE